MTSAGPLEGLRVLDLTQMLAGPYATMLLADLGADVLKVEPLTGDPTRRQGPFLADDEQHAYGGYFQSVNRNKRSIALDLKAPRGRDVLHKLASSSDVVAENFRAGVADRLGISYESLHETNPKLVYASVRGFGDPRTGESPYVDWPAFDPVAQAMGGLMGITGPDADHPLKAGPGLGDLIPAGLAALGILAAVRHADRTGEGQMVDVAMYDAILAYTERIVFQYAYAGIVDRPQGNSHPLLCPFDAFPCSDGWVTVAAPLDPQWRELCALIGRDDLVDDERYRGGRRVKYGDEVRAIVTEWTSTRTKQEVLATLGGRVPCGPVNTAADIFADPHVAAREMLVPVDHPGSPTRPMIAGVPIKLTRTPGGVRHRAPLLGEHTTESLATAGLSREEVAELMGAGVVA